MLGPAATNWTYLVANHTIEQPNYNDCEICVLITMRLLMGGFRELMDEKTVPEVVQLLADMRVRVAEELMAGIINPRNIKVPFAE
jgi:hypothetical protein